MTLRITAILLAVFCSINLRAADTFGDEALAGHPSETASPPDGTPASTIQFGNNGLILFDRDPHDRKLVEKVNSLFQNRTQAFPFSPRLIRQSNYDIDIVDESLLSDEFLNDNTLQKRITGRLSPDGTGIIQTSGTVTLWGTVILNDDSDVVCSSCLDADDQPIDVLLVDCDEECAAHAGLEDCDAGCPATASAHLPEPPPELPADGVQRPSFIEIQHTLPTADARLKGRIYRLTDSALPHPARLDHLFRDFTPTLRATSPTKRSNTADLSTENGRSFARIGPGKADAEPAASTIVTEACSNAEPPLKAKVEHLLEAARHLAGAGYEEEAKLFRVEAEAIQRASTRLLSEKRQELEQLQREIAELEALTGQYAMIQIDCRIMEFSLPSDCAAGAELSALKQSGFCVLSGTPCSPDSKAAAQFLSGDELASFLDSLKHHPCGSLKTLAEPTIVTMNGRPATLRSGGEFPILIPVAAEAPPHGSATIEWRNFGLMMQAVPFILGDGKVRLRLETELSDRDFSNTTNLNGAVVPGLTTRRFNSEVETQFGETVAIACSSVRAKGDAVQSLLLLVTTRQIEPPAKRPTIAE